MFSSNSLFILYKATSPSGKAYIGITCETLSDRISKHLYTAQKAKHKFAKAINKYGIENIKFEILLKDLSRVDAIVKEKEYIKQFNTFKFGYNSTLGGEGAWGYRWDKEEHKKVHAKKFKYYNDPEWCKRKSETTKEFLRKNPKAKQDMINVLVEYNKNKSPEIEAKRILAATSRVANLKKSITVGAKPFNIYSIKNKQYLGTYQMRSECAKDFGIHHTKIIACLKKQRNQHKGFLFKFVDDPTVNSREFNNDWLLTIKRKT